MLEVSCIDRDIHNADCDIDGGDTNVTSGIRVFDNVAGTTRFLYSPVYATFGDTEVYMFSALGGGKITIAYADLDGLDREDLETLLSDCGCCGSGSDPLLVNNSALGYIPTTTGNVSNLNELVTDSAGDQWIIDVLGNAKKLNGGGTTYTAGTGISIVGNVISATTPTVNWSDKLISFGKTSTGGLDYATNLRFDYTTNSFTLGTRAAGTEAIYSASFGTGNIVNDWYSLSVGSNLSGSGGIANVNIGSQNTLTSANYSFVLGQNGTYTGNNGIMTGSANAVNGSLNTVFGANHVVNGGINLVSGIQHTVNASYVTALGYYTSISHDGVTVLSDIVYSGLLASTVPNQLIGRFGNGYKFMLNAGTTAVEINPSGNLIGYYIPHEPTATNALVLGPGNVFSYRSVAGFSKWTDDGAGGIYRNSKVMINSNSPASGALETIINSTSEATSITRISHFADAVYITRNSGAGKHSLVLRGSDGIGAAIEQGRTDSSLDWKTYLAFYTNNLTPGNVDQIQESMRINGTGLGLFTASPTRSLDVNGNARIRTVANNNALTNLLAIDGSGNVEYRTVASLPFTNNVGTVTNFSANDLNTTGAYPVFTVSVTNPTTTPDLSFTLPSMPQKLVLASPWGISGTPFWRQLQTSDLQQNGATTGQVVMWDGTAWNPGTITGGVPTTRTITINGVTQDLSANRTWNVGTVTAVSAGNGMTFTTINTSGAVTLGTPTSITLSSTNSVATNSHTHAFAPGGTTAQYIRGDGSLATFPTGTGNDVWFVQGGSTQATTNAQDIVRTGKVRIGAAGTSGYMLSVVGDAYISSGVIVNNNVSYAGFNTSASAVTIARLDSSNRVQLSQTGTNIILPSYLSTRNDSGTTFPANTLYTDASGNLLSAPFYLSGNVYGVSIKTTNTAITAGTSNVVISATSSAGNSQGSRYTFSGGIMQIPAGASYHKVTVRYAYGATAGLLIQPLVTIECAATAGGAAYSGSTFVNQVSMITSSNEYSFIVQGIGGIASPILVRASVGAGTGNITFTYVSMRIEELGLV